MRVDVIQRAARSKVAMKVDVTDVAVAPVCMEANVRVVILIAGIHMIALREFDIARRVRYPVASRLRHYRFPVSPCVST